MSKIDRKVVKILSNIKTKSRNVQKIIFSCFLYREQKVAIKTLKKRESSFEFLKEAKTASSLKHENIVELIGVCIESNFIILELMEGGDLLSYLKAMRKYLTVWDLVEMSHDVAKGCAYLERMHYVHRDLAARNCLLTSTDPTTRKVNKAGHASVPS